MDKPKGLYIGCRGSCNGNSLYAIKSATAREALCNLAVTLLLLFGHAVNYVAHFRVQSTDLHIARNACYFTGRTRVHRVT